MSNVSAKTDNFVIVKDIVYIFSIKVLDIVVGYLSLIFLPGFTDLLEKKKKFKIVIQVTG